MNPPQAMQVAAVEPGRGAPARRGMRWPRPSRRMWSAVASLSVVLLAWVAFTWVWPLIDPGRFPSPHDVFEAALQLSGPEGYAGATLSGHVWQSSKLVLAGFGVASGIGVPLGLLMGWSRRAEALLNPAFLLLRPIPPLAWIPLAILWFGLGDGGKVFVIFFAAFVPAVINSHTGVRGVDRTLIAAARVHGASTRHLVRDVLLPGSLPSIFTGLRLSLQAAWTTLVAAELVGALMTAALGWLERKVMPWRT